MQATPSGKTDADKQLEDSFYAAPFPVFPREKINGVKFSME